MLGDAATTDEGNDADGPFSPVLDGLVIKAVNIWYDVQTADGVIHSQPRGRLKLRRDGAGAAGGGGSAILVGDRVRCRRLADGTGVIEEILPRRNMLIRPSVANVDQVLVVFTASRSGPDLEFIDRILVLAAHEGLLALLALNKIDLVSADTHAPLEDVARVYRRAGYPFYLSSALTGEGVDELASHLRGRVTVVAGQSGVGKSSLLNAIAPGLSLRTGTVSVRGDRGRHTTRHVELLPMSDPAPDGAGDDPSGWVADAPGFSRLDLNPIPRDHLAALFPELAVWSEQCRFRGCLHEREPGCAVAGAVREGAVDAGRYNRYLGFLAEIREWDAHRR